MMIRDQKSFLLFELRLTTSLLTMQMFSIVAAVLGSITSMTNFITYYRHERLESSGSTFSIWRLAYGIYGCIPIGLLVYMIINGIKSSESSAQALHELTLLCPKYERLQPPKSAKNVSTFLDFFLENLFTITLTSLGVVFYNFFPIPRELKYIAIPSLSMFVGLSYYIYLLSDIQEQRVILREILGDKFVTDEWGLGQLILVAIWMPTILQTLWIILCKITFSLLLNEIIKYLLIL
jgi:hypothetical protein